MCECSALTSKHIRIVPHASANRNGSVELGAFGAKFRLATARQLGPHTPRQNNETARQRSSRIVEGDDQDMRQTTISVG